MEEVHTIKNSISLANIKDIPLALAAFEKNNNISIYKLSKKLDFGMNRASRLRDGLINMKLIEQNHGFHLSQLGKNILDEYIKNNKNVDPILIRTATLNVYLFSKVYSRCPEDKDVNAAYSVMTELMHDLDKNIDKKTVGSATKRFLEGVYGIKLPNCYRWDTNYVGEFNIERITTKICKPDTEEHILKKFIQYYDIKTDERIDLLLDCLYRVAGNKKRLKELRQPTINWLKNHSPSDDLRNQ